MSREVKIIDPLLIELNRETRILGVDLEHRVHVNTDGSFAFATWVDGEWTEFFPYSSINAVRIALLALQTGANPWQV